MTDSSRYATRDRFRRVFAIPVTPIDAAGELDAESKSRCVDFCIQAGVIGRPTTRAPSAAIVDEGASSELDLSRAELSPLLSADAASPPRVG